jgi:hypothetical protein
VSPERQTNLIGARVAIVKNNYANDPVRHRYGVLRGIVPVDRYRFTYLIQPDDPEGFAESGNARPLYRILEVSNVDESCYVVLDPRHIGTLSNDEALSLSVLLGAIGESASLEQLKRVGAELTIEQKLLFMEMLEIAKKLRNRQP